MPFLQLIRKLLCPEIEVFKEDAEQGHPDSIKRRGWLQWSCISSADLPSVLRSTALDRALASLDKDARLLVVSQSCDLVHHSFESEPFAEAYLCEPLAPDAPENGNLTAGKNPRELLVPFTVDGVERLHRLHSKGRLLLPRQRLADIDPDPALMVPPSSIRILQRWLINRGEAVEKALGDIAVAYSGIEGIGICDYRVWDESEAAMSLQRTHRLFPLDYLSLRPKPGDDLPPPA